MSYRQKQLVATPALDCRATKSFILVPLAPPASSCAGKLWLGQAKNGLHLPDAAAIEKHCLGCRLAHETRDSQQDRSNGA